MCPECSIEYKDSRHDDCIEELKRVLEEQEAQKKEDEKTLLYIEQDQLRFTEVKDDRHIALEELYESIWNKLDEDQ